MRPGLFAASLLLAAMPAMANLPPSLDQAVIRSCAPASIEAATECLDRSLSAEDKATLTGAPLGGGYRGHIDAFLIEAWQLDDPDAPLPTHMRERRLYGGAQNAAGLIISNLSARLRGMSLNWQAVAEALQRPAIERRVGQVQTQETHDAD